MVIPLTLLRAADLRMEVQALFVRAHVEADRDSSSEALRCDVTQTLAEAASLPNSTALEQKKMVGAIDLADRGEVLQALTVVDEVLSQRIPPG